MTDLEHPNRRRPAHHPPIERPKEPVIVLVTVCTQGRQPVLAGDAIHGLCREIWHSADLWRVGRYVVMPDHIHLFCAPGRIPMPDLRQWIEFWKSQIGRRVSRIADGTIRVSAVPGAKADGVKPVTPEGVMRVSGGPASTRAGFGIENPDGVEPVPPGGGNPSPSKLWQRDFWDTQMRSRTHYDEKWVYVRMNPVRQGLAGSPDEWPFQGEVFPLAWR